jgi:hypothetical protein
LASANNRDRTTSEARTDPPPAPQRAAQPRISKPMTQNILTVSEGRLLSDLEKTIEAGKQTFVDVGLALTQIRNDRLYRATHGSFQCYCEERWNFSRVQAHRLIDAANVVSALPIGNSVGTESQARELAKVEPARRVEVLKKATSPSGKVTAKSIAAAAGADRGTKDPEPPIKRIENLVNQFCDDVMTEVAKAKSSKHMLILDALERSFDGQIKSLRESVDELNNNCVALRI